MIVVDTNLIAHLFIHGKRSGEAEGIFRRDSRWTAPLLWRSEFRSVLVKCVRAGHLRLEDAVEIASEAERLMAGGEYAVGSAEVLRTAFEGNSSGKGYACSAYDAEFIVLARELGITFVTVDERLQKSFPGTAVAPGDFS